MYMTCLKRDPDSWRFHQPCWLSLAPQGLTIEAKLRCRRFILHVTTSTGNIWAYTDEWITADRCIFLGLLKLWIKSVGFCDFMCRMCRLLMRCIDIESKDSVYIDIYVTQIRIYIYIKYTMPSTGGSAKLAFYKVPCLLISLHIVCPLSKLQKSRAKRNRQSTYFAKTDATVLQQKRGPVTLFRPLVDFMASP